MLRDPQLSLKAEVLVPALACSALSAELSLRSSRADAPVPLECVSAVHLVALQTEKSSRLQHLL